jgi:hypothetical protein
MAATRTKDYVLIQCEGGGPLEISIMTLIIGTDTGYQLQQNRLYAIKYADLTSGQASVVDDFLSDIDTYLNNQDPLT